MTKRTQLAKRIMLVGWTLGILLLSFSKAQAQTPVFIKDINQTTENNGNSDPHPYLAVGNVLFFSAFDGTHGRELWKSDGTPAGTMLVKDIYPGDSNSNPTHFTNFNGTLFFVANDGVHGYEIWKSDGTSSGTVLMTEINVGIQGSVSSGVESGGETVPMFVFNGQMYFDSNDQIHGDELWRTDGTPEGTVRWGPWDHAEQFVTIGQTFYFSHSDATNGGEVWQSDGTATGTTVITDIHQPGDNAGCGLLYVNGTMYCTTSIGGVSSLLKLDGTASGGAVLLAQFYAMESVGHLNGTLFFSAFTFPTTDGWNLWKSDGTPAGTVKLTAGNVRPNTFSVANGTLLFIEGDGNNGSLWKSDGTVAGTVVVKAINPMGGGITGGIEAVVANNLLYFYADDGVHGQELWRSDGTDSGTVMVKDIALGQLSSFPGGFVNADPVLYFSADNGTGIGRELWMLNLENSVGPGVVAQPVDTASGTSPVGMTFSNVTQGGTTSLTISSVGPPPPAGFKLGSPPVYYDLTTTAVFSGPVTVCINYSGINFGNESNLRLSHLENSLWVDRTVSLDTTNNIICGEVTSFSPFAILEQESEGPVTSNVLAASNPVAIGANFTVTATVDDSTKENSIIASAQVNVDSAGFVAMNAVDGGFDETVEAASLTIPGFMQSGVYNICVRGTDSAGNTGASECVFLPVYDPSAGFVTGGGWITSPLGAYVASPSLAGKASFGFVSKYKKGQTVPTGETEFQFQTASFNFASSIYEWLVVSGARAQYKGSGVINGSGNYGFLLTAVDGQINGGGGVDKFRIKIWDKATNLTVYDNQIASSDGADLTTPGTLLGGGSIVIHTIK